MSRGRGRGQLTFNAEALGIGRGDTPTSVLTPPPKYPQRLGKPRPLIENPDQTFLVETGQRLFKKMRCSKFYLKKVESKDDEKIDDELNWSLFPMELKPGNGSKISRKRKIDELSNENKRPRKDINKTLTELEKREASKDFEEGDDEEENPKKKKDDNDSDDEEKNKDNLEESGDEDADEEMDDGTDYANNYFDNGEGYLDEDDENLDEGGYY